MLINAVAPFAGAWIEINSDIIIENFINVAPFAGAWIEICVAYRDMRVFSRRSLRGSVD